MAEQYKRNPNTKCIICGKQIYKRPIEIIRNKGKIFCSTVCHGISCRKEKPCLVCGKPILAKFNKKTCSRSCANKHRAGIQYKINRPKDKVVSERALKIRLFMIRDKKCERCQYSEFRILQAHHKNRNKNDNNMDNLELLCPNCHFTEHYLEKSWLNNINGEFA